MITQHKQEYQIYFDKTFLLQSYGHENQLITPNFNLMAVQFCLMTILNFFYRTALCKKEGLMARRKWGKFLGGMQ